MSFPRRITVRSNVELIVNNQCAIITSFQEAPFVLCANPDSYQDRMENASRRLSVREVNTQIQVPDRQLASPVLLTVLAAPGLQATTNPSAISAQPDSWSTSILRNASKSHSGTRQIVVRD